MEYPDELAREEPGALPHGVLRGAGREEFWADTCREVTQMVVGSKPVRDLYRNFGCRFCAPTHQQVQSVLEALDSALPTWEKNHPELFYETLELNFPELVRHP